jgi:hypothetical protein
LRAAGETEITQENIQDCFELLTDEEIAATIFSFISISTAYIIKFYIYLFLYFLGLSFASLIHIIALSG